MNQNKTFSRPVPEASEQGFARWMAFAGFTLALQACTVFPDSPAAKIYALDLPAASPRAACAVRFAIRDVRLPGYLDRPEVVLRREASRTEISAQHLWAAPLAAETTRLMGLGLQESLQGSQMMPYPVRVAERPDWIIAPVLTRFQTTSSSLDISFSVTAFSTGTTSQTRLIGPVQSLHSVALRTEAGVSSAASAAEAMTMAYSQNIKAHIGDIAIALKAGICP